jgi:predicted dehydrogenase
MNYVFEDNPVKVTGNGGINFWKDGRDTYDNIHTIYEFASGRRMTVSSVLSNAYTSYNIKILGDRGTIDIQRTKAMLYPESAAIRRGTVDGVTGATYAAIPGKAQELTYEKTLEPTIYSLESFVDCIKNKKEPVSNVLKSKDTSIALHMGNAAADTGITQLWKPEYSL